ncbi:hypothetical protein LCGC14_1948290, partial [marine sediment metagenome]
MIIGLYNFLHRNILGRIGRTFRRSVGNPNNFFLVLATLGFLYITERITIGTTIWLAIPTAILYTGVLISPYVYLTNMIILSVQKKFFKKHIYIYSNGHRRIDFRKGKYYWLNKAVGIMVADKIYLDDEYNDFILWGMGNRIVYINNLRDFIEDELTKRDSPETIKRRILLK